MSESTVSVRASGGAGGTEHVLSLSGFLRPFVNSDDLRAQVEGLIQRLGLHKNEGRRTVLFTGADSGVGTSSVVVSTAWTLATQHRIPTLIIGADLREAPDEEVEVRGTGAMPGFRQLIGDPGRIDEVVARTETEGLWVIPAGGGTGGLAGADLAGAIDAVVEQFPIVIIDTAPVLDDPETALLAAIAEKTVIVAGHRITQRRRLGQATDLLRASGANVTGTVLNRVSNPLPEWIQRRL